MSSKVGKEIYQEYLPEIVQDTKQFQCLSEIEGEILQKEKDNKDSFIKDQWILTATQNGLMRRAKMLGISEKLGEDIEELRQRVLFRWNEHCPYTYYTLLNWLDGFCGAENYTCSLWYHEYRLQIILELKKKILQKEVNDVVRRMIPANLILEVFLRYNRYIDVKGILYSKLKESMYRYQDIKENELKHMF